MHAVSSYSPLNTFDIETAVELEQGHTFNFNPEGSKLRPGQSIENEWLLGFR